MGKESKFKGSLDRISSIFKGKKETKGEDKELHIPVVRLNFFLLNAAFKMIQKGESKKPLSLFTTKILNSRSEHFAALIKQAESVCSKQDIELFSYKEFYSQNHFSLRRAVQWKFSKYIKSKQEAAALINKMKESSPEAFKRHLITLLKDEDLTPYEIEQEAQELEEQYSIWHHGGSAPITVSPL
ncbi:MAG: hypothetical protein KFB93_06075 [Simkaniaceae bacterium]|nr:MAG: hypothetical protein KFB93_06075 [Simkaniaceae bacterium]